MNHLDQPLDTLSDAIGAAIHRDLPAVSYKDRDWPRYNQWRREVFNKMAPDEKRALYEQERESRIPMGPPDCQVEKQRRPARHEVEVVMFPQMWASTALGYGGIGGASMTSAYTVVITHGIASCVYFGAGGRLAYQVNRRCPAFVADLKTHQLCSRRDAGKYDVQIEEEVE